MSGPCTSWPTAEHVALLQQHLRSQQQPPRQVETLGQPAAAAAAAARSADVGAAWAEVETLGQMGLTGMDAAKHHRASGAAVARPAARKHSLCEHKRQRSRCRECGGVGICPHGREFRRCKDCKGPGLCKHLREKKSCKECYAGQTLPGNCQHNRRKSLCRECGGAGICEHNRIRSMCNDLGGASICQQNRQRGHQHLRP